MIHVAILMKPYVDLLLKGMKTIECRLTKQARAPYEAIEPAERIYFKQSSGPYQATALVEHVMFVSDLTPRQVVGLQRDYNEQICGDDAFWKWKRNSRYASLIWLRDIQPVDTGPDIPPLQGVAWKILKKEPAWRRHVTGAHSFCTTITEGNIRNNTLYVTKVMNRFPPATIGGRTKNEAGNSVTLILFDGPMVRSDIVGARKLIRSRVWGKWFRQHKARPGDQVVFSPIDESTFTVGLTRSR